MTLRFTGELALAGREINRIRTDLNHADVSGLGLAAPVPERERSATIRAYCYIWLAAVLERVVADTLREVLAEINVGALPHRDIRTSLFGLLCDGELQSISDRSRQTGWSIRVALFARLADASPTTFASEILPLDGRTLRAEHFDTIWLVFGLDGDSMPTPRHRASLRELADGRNNVAHGKVDPVTFGKTKATSDIATLTNRVEDIVAHFVAAMDDYLQCARYRR